jgi:hypothetical protein
MHRKLREYLISRGFREEDGRERGILYGMIDDVYVTATPSGCTGSLSTFYFSMSCPGARLPRRFGAAFAR